MRKIPRKLLILIFIVNFIVMILEGTTAIDNNTTTIINNQMEENRLEVIKGKGEITVVSPLYKGAEAIVVPMFSTINFKSDLKNTVVGVEKGTVFLNLAEEWKKSNLIKDIVIFDTSADLLNAINGNKVDAGIIDSVILKYYLLKNKNLILRMLKNYTPEVIGTVGIAIRQNDATLLHAFNEKINEMKADGTLYAILVRNGLDKANMIFN